MLSNSISDVEDGQDDLRNLVNGAELPIAVSKTEGGLLRPRGPPVTWASYPAEAPALARRDAPTSALRPRLHTPGVPKFSDSQNVSRNRMRKLNILRSVFCLLKHTIYGSGNRQRIRFIIGPVFETTKFCVAIARKRSLNCIVNESPIYGVYKPLKRSPKLNM